MGAAPGHRPLKRDAVTGPRAAEPSARPSDPAGPIDVVISWVDGSDPVHAAKRARFAGAGAHRDSVTATRFSDNGELFLTLLSIVRFAPFVRQVLVVTDDQHPVHVTRVRAAHPHWAERIRVVDHARAFAGHEECLPVFNSRSIETAMHRIADLADRFIYLNDDIMLARPLDPSRYFDRDGPVLQGEVRPLPNRTIERAKRLGRRLLGRRERAGFMRAQAAGARLAGRERSYLVCGHHPHAMRRSTSAAFFASRPDVLRRQLGYRFRDDRQFSPIGLANNLELEAGRPVRERLADGYLRPGRGDRRVDAVLGALERGELDSLCVQSLDLFDTDQAARIRATVGRHLGA